VRDLIFDGNYFVAGPGTQVALSIHCPRVTVRNNVFDMSAGLAHQCIGVARSNSPDPSDFAVLHNTCYSSAGSAVLTNGIDRWSNVAVVNNLVVSPSSPSVGASPDNDVLVEGNIETGDGGFVAGSPAQVEDFRLDSGSPARNAAVELPVAIRDLEGTLRPEGPASDVGAFEGG